MWQLNEVNSDISNTLLFLTADVDVNDFTRRKFETCTNI